MHDSIVFIDGNDPGQAYRGTRTQYESRQEQSGNVTLVSPSLIEGEFVRVPFKNGVHEMWAIETL